MRVIGKHRLVAFELLPRNVTGMMVANQDHPCITRLEMPLALSGASIDDLGSGFRFAEGIGARVHRIPSMCQMVLYTGSFQTTSCPGVSRTSAGRFVFSPRNHSSTCRALPNSTILVNTRCTASCTRRSGSISTLPLRGPPETDWQSELEFPAASFLANGLQ